MFKRDLKASLVRGAKFPVVVVLGPRQSGKTTLVRSVFKKHSYISFEDPAIREFAASDPRGFLSDNENKHGVILDEFQYVPSIVSYIQLEVDTKKRAGYFILTGSHNFLMNQAITQSLAGRTAIFTLLPLSLHELKENKIRPEFINDAVIKGGYPRLYDQELALQDFFSSYIHSYVEKDVRQLVNVGDLRTFQKFLSLCAGRIGQLLNLSDLATQCGISLPTVHRWLSILEASYVVFVLQPHFNNFNKRLTKTPKLYFYDTGVACSLLGITSSKILAQSPFRGALFENLIITDFAKQFYNLGKRPPIYFWRDSNGRIEVDCILEIEAKLYPIEIKSSQTISLDFFKGLAQWNELSGTKPSDSYVVYGGQANQVRTRGNIISWQFAGQLVAKLYKKS